MVDDLQLFTVEANGDPIVVLAASDLDHARDIAEREGKLGEEPDLEKEYKLGEEVKTGEWVLLGACKEDDALAVRVARNIEKEHWRTVVHSGREEGVVWPDDDITSYIVFLVPISDPTDDAFDEGGFDRKA